MPGQVPSPQIALTLEVPRRLALRVGAHGGRLTIVQLASADVEGSRGDTRVTAIAGAATIDQASGTLTIDDCGSLHLQTRNGRARVTRIGATASITASGGSMALSGIRGPLDIESRNADVSLSDSPALAGPLRVNATGGTVRVAGLRIDARIETRNAAVDVDADSPAPISIESTRGGIHITPPAAGYTLDAVATDGRVRFADGALTPVATDAGQTAAGPVRGGGATLTLRASHADIEVRPHASGK
jgi:ferric-dicitrate binding protein FerR (iron transport regulator)